MSVVRSALSVVAHSVRRRAHRVLLASNNMLRYALCFLYNRPRTTDEKEPNDEGMMGTIRRKENRE